MQQLRSVLRTGRGSLSTVAQLTPVSDQGPDGRLEAVIDGQAVGWAFDSSAPRERVALQLHVDGARVGCTVADLARPSLAHAGIGDGRHAFAIELPGRLRDGAAHVISLLLPTGEPLRVTHPLRVTASESAPEWSHARLRATGDPLAFEGSPGSEGLAASSAYVSAVALPADPAGPPRLRLRPCEETHFQRRESKEGFSDGDEPETIFLSDHVMMRRPDPLCFAVQPGVGDPLAERKRRFGQDGSYLARRAAICRLPRGIVDTSAFLICPDEHRYLGDSVRGIGFMPWFGYSALPDWSFARDVEVIVEREERVVVLGAQTNYNFSHWLLESLARALLFRPFDDGSWRYLVPKLDHWQRQTLERVGLGADRVIEAEAAGLARFREVIAVSRGMPKMREFIPSAVAALAALASGAPYADLPRRRLYISRAGTNVRGVSNEPEIAELFARHGFQIVSPELLPFAEQIALFASAAVIAGPHGSGLTGALFSPPGALVIELQPEQQRPGVVEYMWNLCAACDHRFAQVVCRHTPGTEEQPVAHREVTIDPSHLDRLLSSLLPD